MSIIAGLEAGIIAGVIMIIVSETGFLLKLIKGNLIMVDGSFALRLISRRAGKREEYFVGTVIHILTGMVFGLVYAVLSGLLDFEPLSAVNISIYTLILWLAMLFVALPAAGQGILGRKLSRWVWVEQLFLHIIFGLAFRWALGILAL